MGIKEMIARCIERMRARECGRCDNRAACPAGRWQQAFGGDEPAATDASAITAFLGQLFGAFGGRSSFRREVERTAERLLDRGEASIDHVARELGMSRQTLYRRLKADGVTFERILDNLRRRLAMQLLRDERASVKQTAWRLGFSNPAAFSRAFKRWTGASPSAVRS